MAAPRVSRGLSKVQVPVYIGAGIDTKNNPKLVQPGSLLELENMYQLRTGELRLRNGFAALPAARVAGATDNLFALPGGGLESIQANWLGIIPWKLPVKYIPAVGSGNTGWESPTTRGVWPFPIGTALLSGIEAVNEYAEATPADLVDPTIGSVGSYSLAAWVEAGNQIAYSVRSTNGGQLVASSASSAIFSNGRPPVVTSGSGWTCMFSINASGPPAGISVYTYSAAGTFTNSTTIAAGAVAAGGFIDAKPIPGGNRIAVAYTAASGISCLIFDPSTNTVVTGPVNTAAADANQCFGWLDDSLATGNLYLATAGTTAGVVVRTMSATTLAVSATNTIDGTATANVRQITGHINASATDYRVLWEVSASPTYNSIVKMGAWTGSATVIAWAKSFGIYSRSFKASDGRYYFVASYDSPTQPTYSVLGTDPYDGTFATSALMAATVCQVLATSAGGRRTVASSLSNGYASAAGTWITALPRVQQSTIAGTTTTSLRSIAQAELTFSSKLYRPRELGGTFFFPGGLIKRDDGRVTSNAVIPFYLEQPTLVSSATGSMTVSGAYAYRLVLKRTDATGRVTRSAGSVVTTITLGAGDGRVTLTIQNPGLIPMELEDYTIEVYRAGPAAAGNVDYHKVGELLAQGASPATTLTYVDSVSDATAALGAFIPSTGNTLENFPPPSCRLLEVNAGRLWIVNAEDPTELWPSKEYKPGDGIGFNPLLALRITGDGYGGMTALAAMDGRPIAFKRQAIYVISGDGPNDLGQGTFNPPQATSLSVGTTLPGSVVAVPDGIMFQGAAGIYLLDRGLGLTYIGKPVEQYTLAEDVVDASLVQGINQARFVMASGRCLVWDYDLKTWSTYKLRVDGSTIVACANIPSGWCYALANGTVYQETPGVYADVNGTSTPIVPRVGFPHLNLAGLAGYQRIYKVEVVFDPIGAHTIALDCEFDYSGAVTGTPRTKSVTVTAASAIVEYNPPSGHAKSTAIRPVLTTSALAAGSGAFRFTGLAVTVGVKRGNNTPFTNRLT